MPKNIFIDVINPSDFQSKLLQLLFIQNENKKNPQEIKNVFKRMKKDRHIDLIVSINGVPQHIQLQLSHTIRRFKRSRDKPGFRYYAVSNKVHANGAFGRVKKIVAKYALQDGELILKRNKKRILKKVRLTGYTYLQRLQALEREYNLTLKAKHMRVKPLFIEASSMDAKGYFVMKELVGEDLSDVIDRDRSFKPDIPPLSTKERVIYAINLLRALRDQIHGNGLVHRDIKPKNIKVTVDGKIQIFDFGISKPTIENDDGQDCCTPQYAPPELLKGKGSSTKSDIYSAGVTLAKLFGAELRTDTDGNLMDLIEEYLQTQPYTSLFVGIPELSQEHKNALSALFETMTAKKAEQRPEINDCLVVLENILQDLILAETPILAHDSVKQALSMAIQIDRELSNVSHSNDFISLHFKPALPSLISAIESAVKSIDDTEIALKTFIAYSDIDIFQGLTSKKDLVNKTKKVVNEFDQHIDTLISLHDDARRYANSLPVTDRRLADKIKRLMFEITLALGKHEAYNFTLNDIALLNEKYQPDLANFKARMAEICKDPAIIKIDLNAIIRNTDDKTMQHAVAITGMQCLNKLNKYSSGLSIFKPNPEVAHIRQVADVLMANHKNDNEFRKVIDITIENIPSGFLNHSHVKNEFKEVLRKNKSNSQRATFT